jgi:hypothetical protein
MAAGLTNILGILLFSRGFHNPHLGQAFPGLFGNWGLVCIMLWGLAYLSVASSYKKVPLLIAVFALEKAVYVASWLWWLSHHDLAALWAQDPLTGAFFALYGIIDLGFCLFFLRMCRSER